MLSGFAYDNAGVGDFQMVEIVGCDKWKRALTSPHDSSPAEAILRAIRIRQIRYRLKRLDGPGSSIDF